MVKEKQVFVQRVTINGESLVMPDGFRYDDPQRVFGYVQVKNIVTQILAENGVQATVTDDTYSYKLGFMKSGSAPCLLISEANKPNDYAKVAIVVMENENGEMLYMNGWYGESKFDRMLEKAKKKEKKLDKKANKFANSSGDVLDTLGGLGALKVREKLTDGYSKKTIARDAEETPYHKMILSIVNTINQTVRCNLP